MKDKKMMRRMKTKMKRILLDGSEVEEFDNAIDITIHTKCPGKWKLTDMETGSGTVSGGQFDWGGRLPNCNGGVQRFPQVGLVS